MKNIYNQLLPYSVSKLSRIKKDTNKTNVFAWQAKKIRLGSEYDEYLLNNIDNFQTVDFYGGASQPIIVFIDYKKECIWSVIDSSILFLSFNEYLLYEHIQVKRIPFASATEDKLCNNRPFNYLGEDIGLPINFLEKYQKHRFEKRLYYKDWNDFIRFLFPKAEVKDTTDNTGFFNKILNKLF